LIFEKGGVMMAKPKKGGKKPGGKGGGKGC